MLIYFRIWMVGYLEENFYLSFSVVEFMDSGLTLGNYNCNEVAFSLREKWKEIYQMNRN